MKASIADASWYDAERSTALAHVNVGTSDAKRAMRHPDRWLALLRITVGLWFLKSILTKISIALLAGFIPTPVASPRWIATMPKLIARYAADNPFPAYKAFLLGTVVPNHAYAHLTALGEVAVGLSLTFGLLTEVGAVFGALQVITYGLAVQHMSSGQQGFHVMLLAMMLAFLFAGAGRTWGLDAVLAERWVMRRERRRRIPTRRASVAVGVLGLVALGTAPSTARAQRGLVSNEGGNTVSVIEGNAVVATFDVGARPRGLAVAPDGRRAYVALGKDNAVGVIDIAARRVVDTIPVGADPEQVSVSPDGRTIYVSNEALDSATAVAVTGHQMRFRAAVGREPEGILVGPRGTKVYITGETDSTVTALDASSGQRVGVMHVGARPRFIVFAPNGQWGLVSTEDGGLVHVFDVRRDSVTATITIGDRTTKPTGIAISPDGRFAYIANGRANQVSVVDVTGRSVVASIPVGQRPWGVALTPDGATLYVANGRSNSVSVISTAQRRVTATIPVGERPYTVVLVP
jgi:YVTN family beta-propeller protein